MRVLVLLVACVLALAVALPAAAQTCPPGASSPTGNAPCTPCPAGTFAASSGSLQCTPCAAGFYSAAGSASCTPCPAGSFSSGPGSASCQTCPDGYINPYIGMTSCQPCQQGYTSDATHTHCVLIATPGLPASWGHVKVIYR